MAKEQNKYGAMLQKLPTMEKAYASKKCLLTLTIYAFIISLALSCSPRDNNQQYLLLFEEQAETPEPIYRLYSTSLDSSEIKQIIEFSSSDLYWLSPNGTYLAIVSPWGDDRLDIPAQSLIILDVLSSEVVDKIPDVGYSFPEINRIYLSNNSVAWSPQGDKLVYEKKTIGSSGSALWLYDINTGSNTPLTDGKSIDRNAAWSPTGEQIAYVSGHPCHEEDPQKCPSEESYWNIVILDVDAQVQRVITDFQREGVLPYMEGIIMLCNLLWSPDGRFIAFENECNSFSITNNREVFIVSTDGTNLTQVADDVESSHATTSYDYSYQWSSSSDKLYIGYSRAEYLEPIDSYGGFLILDVRTLQTIRSIEILGLSGEMASWSKDKQQILVFTDHFEGNTKIPGSTFLSRLSNDGAFTIESISSQLPFGSCNELDVYWSPDGKYITYAMSASRESCNDELGGRGVAIVSPSQGYISNVVESQAKGLYRPVGWVIVSP